MALSFLKPFNIHHDYFKKEYSRLTLALILGVLKNAAAFLLSVSIGEFFNLHFHSSGSKGKLLNMLGLKFEVLDTFILFFIGLILFRSLIEFTENYIITIQGEKFVKMLREKAFYTQMNWGIDQFREKYYGKYLLRYSNDMKAIQNYLTKGVFGGLRDIIYLIMGFTLLSLLNHTLTLIYLLLSLFFLLIAFFISGKQKSMIQKSRTERSVLLSLVSRSFQRHQKIKVALDEEKSLNKFEDQSVLLFQANKKNHQFESILLGVYAMMQYTLILIVMLFISIGHNIRIHKGDALVFVLIMMLLNSPLKRILKVPATINKGLISFEKIESIINTKPAEIIS